MLKLITTIIFINFGLIISAQKIDSEKVLQVSDSIILSKTNEVIFKHFQSGGGSYYKYRKGNKVFTKSFSSKKRIEAKTEEIWILYHFYFSEIEGIRGNTWVKLDGDLKLIEEINLDFIPEFLWNNNPSNFISKQDAFQTAFENFKVKGLKIEEPTLIYNRDFKQYVFQVNNILTKEKNEIGNDTGEIEVVFIDAISGELVKIDKIIYGVIIR